MEKMFSLFSWLISVFHLSAGSIGLMVCDLIGRSQATIDGDGRFIKVTMTIWLPKHFIISVAELRVNLV